MSSLADLLTPPINASGASYLVEQRQKVVTSTDTTLASLETAINDWLAQQSALTPTYFFAPVYLGSTGSGGNLRYSVLIPYGYFVPPPV